jgi:hypothetical protein
MPLPYSIRVDIRPSTEGRLKIVWATSDATFPPYEIDRGMLERCAQAVRTQLGTLVKACMGTPPLALAPIIKKLAEEGANLHKSLFHCGDGRDRPEEIRNWLASLPHRCRLTFVVDGYVHVPWGLMYDGNPEHLPENGDALSASTYEAFWCLRYLASCVYCRVQPLGGGDVRQRFDTRVLPVIHRAEYDNSITFMPTEEARALSVMVSEAGGAIETKEALKTKWQELGRTNRVLFFYCHANGQNLALSARDLVSTDFLKLQLSVNDLLPDRIAIGVLNGCSTAVGGNTGGFIEAMSREGFCGFIGTETEVPNIFALRFGGAFLSRLLSSGQHLVEVMDEMRRQHWPLSLLYGIYGYPLLRVASANDAASDSAPIASSPINFSSGPIGAIGL